MRVECNKCNKIFEFERPIQIQIGMFHGQYESFEIEFCEKCEIDLWEYLKCEKKRKEAN